jgi:hypothetical protein
VCQTVPPGSFNNGIGRGWRATYPYLFGRTKTGDVGAIVEYMKWVETERMGLTFNRENAERAAKAMVAWMHFIDDHA